MYQGHMPDGSSIQRHSAGGAYPYVTQLRGNPNGGYYWELIGPGLLYPLRFISQDDLDAAVRRILAVRENEDAWAFELEQLQMVAGQKVMAMQEAAERLVRGRAPKLRSAAFASMARASRVESLLYLGAVRNTLRLPIGGQRVTFAELAAHELDS